MLIVKNNLTTIISVLILALIFSATNCVSGVQPRETPVDFYRGKTIDFTCPAKPGGGIHTFISILAPFIEKYTGAVFV